MSLSVSDVEKVQALYPDYHVELREGKIIVMSPSDSVSGEIAGRFITLLSNWVYTQKTGRVLDSSTGFRLPNGDLLSPDVSFVSRERLYF
jgi:Uma2 family endonuclease